MPQKLKTDSSDTDRIYNLKNPVDGILHTKSRSRKQKTK